MTLDEIKEQHAARRRHSPTGTEYGTFMQDIDFLLAEIERLEDRLNLVTMDRDHARLDVPPNTLTRLTLAEKMCKIIFRQAQDKLFDEELCGALNGWQAAVDAEKKE